MRPVKPAAIFIESSLVDVVDGGYTRAILSHVVAFLSIDHSISHESDASHVDSWSGKKGQFSEYTICGLRADGL